jgi:hypothetical protein
MANESVPLSDWLSGKEKLGAKDPEWEKVRGCSRCGGNIAAYRNATLVLSREFRHDT